MLKVVINGVYYPESGWFSSYNARQKKSFVYFYDYDDYVGYIINSLTYSELQRLRINIYSFCHKLIKFTKWKESNVNDEVFEFYKVESPIIDIDINDFALLLPSHSIRKRFFEWDSIRERYYLKSNFIQFIKFWCLSM